MMQYKIQSTKDTSVEGIRQLAASIKMDQISFIIFFASSHFDFKKVHQTFNETYPSTMIAGATSQGELVVQEGYSEGNLTAISVYGDDFKVAGVVLEDVKRKGMLYKKQVQQTIEKLGIDIDSRNMKDHFFAVSLVDFFSESEEKIMTMLSAVFNDQPIHLVGGSCGSLESGKCDLSFNGKMYSNAAILLFVHTNKKVITYNENIYEPEGKSYRVTAANIGERIVEKIDGIPAQAFYARELGVAKEKLNDKVFASHPIGRIVGSRSYIASPLKTVEKEGIKFYTRVMPGGSIHLMKPSNPLLRADETAHFIHKKCHDPSLVIAFSCILRYVQFKDQNLTSSMYEKLSQIAPVFGATTLGEQIGLTAVNQTLTLLVIEE